MGTPSLAYKTVFAILMKKIDIRWLAVVAGVVAFSIVASQLVAFLRLDKTRFDRNLFSGTHLAIERDKLKYFTTFSHAGVVELAQHYIGVNKSNYNGIFGSDQRATMPLEVSYFKRNDVRDNGALHNFTVFPLSDRFFFNGVQHYTSLMAADISPSRDAWMVGAEADISGVVRRIVGLGKNEIRVEGLLGDLDLPSYIKVSLETKEKERESLKGLALTAYSDTVFWQNGVWVYDSRPMIFGVRVDALPGDSIVFQDGSERVIRFVRSNGIIELDGDKLDPVFHGGGTNILLKRIHRESQSVKRFVNTLTVSNSEFSKGLNRYQRVLLPEASASSLAVNDYVMFADGVLRRIARVGEGYVDLDQYVDPLNEQSEALNNDVPLILSSIQKTILDPRATTRVVRLPAVEPINPRTYLFGNNFLYIQKKRAIVGVPNHEKAQMYREKFAPAPELVKSPTVWATYTGILNVLYDSVHPVNRDYLIHVLGPTERGKYIDDFVRLKPDYVQSSIDNFDNSNFHSWSLNSSWSFYNQLINNYSPVFSYDYMTLWKRGVEPWKDTREGSSAFVKGSLPVILPPSRQQDECAFELLTVTVEYEARNPWKSIPVFGKTDRFLVRKKGAINTLPVSLPPDENSWSFPLLRRPGSSVELSLDEVHPIANLAKIDIKRVGVQAAQVSEENIRKLFFPSYYPDQVLCERRHSLQN